MKQIEVKGEKSTSVIIVGESLLNLRNYIPAKGVFIITDGNVDKLYRAHFPKFPVFVINPGEAHKNLSTAEAIYRWLLEEGADRSSFIVGIGGGVVCDMAGFVASTYMRGVKFGFVSTTLLSQVDASVGGKNGVDFDGYKNVVGTINQPKFVICDISMLATLPITELRCGLAEILKHCLIADKAMFEILETNYRKALSLENDFIELIVEHSVKIKAEIVSNDEREQGDRRKLNLGHTWGHAIEKITGIPHGEAVSIGLAFAAWLSEKRKVLSSSDRKRILDLLSALGLPISSDVSRDAAIEALLRDKKREGSILHFVLIEGIGNAQVESISVDELKKSILASE